MWQKVATITNVAKKVLKEAARQQLALKLGKLGGQLHPESSSQWYAGKSHAEGIDGCG
jgi:hypothetical protein